MLAMWPSKLPCTKPGWRAKRLLHQPKNVFFLVGAPKLYKTQLKLMNLLKLTSMSKKKSK